MTDLALTEALYPTPDELRAQILSDWRYSYAQAGITVNVKKGSDLWHRAGPIANRLALAIANNQISATNVNPLKAQGQALLDLAAVFGVRPRSATASAGFLTVTVLSPATSVTIPLGYRWTSPEGVTAEVTSSTLVSTGDTVPVRATEAGSDSNVAAGVIGTWDATTVGFLDQKAIVASGGLDGGADADDVEDVRARLLRRLSFPRVGGNWAQIADFAETANTAVKFAAVYPAARGPASYDVAILGDADDPVLGSAVITEAELGIIAEMPGHASLNVTSAVLEPLDVVINASLPAPVSAGGIGGGWVDANPWPSTNEPTVKGKVTAVTPASSQITVNSTSADPPAIGDRIAIWNPTTELFVNFTILNVTGPSGAYVLTLDVSSSAMTFVDTTMYVSPQAASLQTYGDLFLAAMQDLGPGEKTDNVDILPWARRRPSPELERPYALTSRQLSAVSEERTEIADISYAARYETGTTTTRTTPSIPATVAQAPRLLTLQNLAFRAVV